MPGFLDDFSSPVIWMSVGIILVLIEVFIVPTLGFLFAGLGAITLGGLMAYDVISTDKIALQVAIWFAFTIGWAAGLWLPMKKARRKKGQTYSDMVGSRGKVGEGDLAQGKTGDVEWSGTTMKARIDEESGAMEIAAGTEIVITKVDGGILHVKEV